jgi:hypothetical protein
VGGLFELGIEDVEGDRKDCRSFLNGGEAAERKSGLSASRDGVGMPSEAKRGCLLTLFHPAQPNGWTVAFLLKWVPPHVCLTSNR